MRYSFKMENFDQSLDNRAFEPQYRCGVAAFNRKTRIGQVTAFTVLPHGFIVEYDVAVPLKCPAAALGRLSREWVQNIPAVGAAVVNGRFCREI